jgi:predicted RNase H-like nuclease (RuvC/YqgF family)
MAQIKNILAELEQIKSKNSILQSKVTDLSNRMVEVEFKNHSLKKMVREMITQENIHLQMPSRDTSMLQSKISYLKTMQGGKISQQVWIKQKTKSWVQVV